MHLEISPDSRSPAGPHIADAAGLLWPALDAPALARALGLAWPPAPGPRLPAPQGERRRRAAPGGNGHAGANGFTDTEVAYARTALEEECRIVATTPHGNRNNQLNESSVKLFEFVAAGVLSESEVEGRLVEAAVASGTTKDYRATIESGKRKGMGQPRDLAAEVKANRPGGGRGKADGIAWHANGEDAGQDTDQGEGFLAFDDPCRLARLYLSSLYRHPDGYTLRYWRDEFHSWSGGAFRRKPDSEIRAELFLFIQAEFDRIHSLALLAYRLKQGRGEGTEKGPPKSRPVTRNLIYDVVQALAGLALLKLREHEEPPMWIGAGPAWDAKDILPTRSALIHLPSLAEDEDCTIRPTPAFFTPYSLDFDFGADAPEPATWLRFLDDIWGDDAGSIASLQEWMGYLLTPDTSLQKILMLTGPRRSGKGTIIRVIRALIGPENVVNPTLSSLATNFGLATLVGKPAAIITDARVSGRTDTAVVVERLLSISGEDAQTVDRKHREAISTKFPTRFMIATNELPKIKDASGALVGRMIFLRMTRSFYGAEDTGLFAKLVRELPGILRWTVRGWVALRGRGKFVQPRSGAEMAHAMDGMASPMKSFLADCCKVGQGEGFSVPVARLYATWRDWCLAKGRENFGDDELFGRELRSVEPAIERWRPRINGTPTYCYKGIRLLDAGEFNEDDGPPESPAAPPAPQGEEEGGGEDDPFIPF